MNSSGRTDSVGEVDLAGTASLEFLEELFAQYQADPASVEPGWRDYFDSLAAGTPVARGVVPAANGQSPAARPPASAAKPVAGNGVYPPVPKLITPDGIATGHAVAISNGDVKLPAAPAGEAMPLPLPVATGTKGEERVAFLQDRVDQLVRAYRVRGHLMAEIDPLGRPRPGLPELDPQFYHLTEEDMDRVFSTATNEGPQPMSLRQRMSRRTTTGSWMAMPFACWM